MSTSSVKLATGPVSWGVDFADAASNPPWELVLDEIVQTGLRALELGPVGYLPEDGEVVAAELHRRGLEAVGSFVFEDLHDPRAHAQITAVAERACRVIAAAGGRLLVLIDRVNAEREATFGRSPDARRLDTGDWASMLDLITGLAALAREHGLAPVVHPHAGGFIEFEDEIDRLLSDVELDLCLDTGHLALAGLDPARALVKYRGRIGHMHFKDVRGNVLERALANGSSFWDALKDGVFCPTGHGVVDFAAVRRELQLGGYGGFATIEQDRTPGSGSPVDDTRESLSVLAAAGFEDAAQALAGVAEAASER